MASRSWTFIRRPHRVHLPLERGVALPRLLVEPPLLIDRRPELVDHAVLAEAVGDLLRRAQQGLRRGRSRERCRRHERNQDPPP